jgi:D-tyrosyl-tRNA(Tyr) deacylase
MRAVVQRVKSASVSVEGERVSSIGPGLLILLGISQDDGDEDIRYMVEKTLKLRIFDDEHGVMNLSLLEAGGEVLLVSQFTLYGDTRKGRRPSYNRAASPDEARIVFKEVEDAYRAQGIALSLGVFQTETAVELINDGPVTILVDSEKKF